MKTTKNLVALLLITSFLSTFITSCTKEDSSTVAQDKIWASYELYYNKNQDKTYARATFKFSNALGTNLQLTAPAKVSCNGDQLTFKSTLAYYEKEYAGFISGGTFSYTDLDNNTFANVITGIRTIEFPIIDTIHTANSFTLNWVGDSLAANEKVTLFLDGINQNNSELFYQSGLSATTIICAANQLQRLGNGVGTGWMERTYSPTIQNATSAGGIIKGVYKAKDLTTVIAN